MWSPLADRPPRSVVGALCLVGDLGRLGAVVARVRHEVLQDHLLEVAVLAVDLRERIESGHALLGRLSDADQDAARERDAQLAGRPDRVEPRGRVLRRRSLVDDEVGVDRLQHQPLRRGHLTQARQLLARAHADVRVREHAALERALAGPGHVGDEVVVAVLGQARRHLGVDLGLLAGQHEQLLGAAPRGVVEQPLDLVRRVQVRAVCGERAVLAVALARPRQRQREVARKRDPSHRPQCTEAGGWASRPARRRRLPSRLVPRGSAGRGTRPRALRSPGRPRRPAGTCRRRPSRRTPAPGRTRERG